MREEWIESSLEDLSDYEIGGDWGKDPELLDENFVDIYCIRGSEFRNWQRDKGSTASHRKVKINSFNSRKLLLHDILVEISGGGPDQPVGRTVIIDNEVLSHFKGKNLMFTNFLRLVRPNHLVNSIYINQYLKYFYSTGEIVKYQAGSNNLRNLKFGDFMKIKFPLPPLPEQRAIVKKLESLFSSLDAGVADLKKAQQQLKMYRQAVLKKAFEGELTKEWREKHSYNMDDFLWELKNKKNTAIKEKLISKGDYFPNYKSENLNFITPSNWLSLPWKTLTSNRKYALKRGPFGSALKKDFFVESGTVVYEQGHAINDDPYRHRYFITPEKFEELKAFAVGAGDLIISCSGATLGRICLLPEDAEVGVINQALLKVDLDEEVILKKYFLILFRSESFQRLIFSKALGSAMPNMVGMEELKEMPIPIPSILEQKEIVKQIESRLSVCDSIEQNIKEGLQKAEALRQSILKKAFEGNLLTAQELAECKFAEDYEPAGVLLERIKAEKKK